MKCRNCTRIIPDNSLFCNWCGVKQLKTKRKETKVPEPRQLKSGAWNIELRKEGVSITEKTREECVAKAKAVRAGLIKAEPKKPKLTLGAVIDKYIADNKGILSPSTIYNYQSYRKHGFTSLMAKDLNNDKIDWQLAVSDEAGDYSAKTVHNHWGLVRKAMVAAGFPAPAVNLPAIPKSERPWLDYEQIQSFLQAVKGQDCELAALLALHSLRRSEFLAVTADDIDLKAGTIRVAGAVVPGEGGVIKKDTNKNASSQRTVPIMIPRLTELLAGREGQLITGRLNDSGEGINAVCAAAGLPLVACHGLRHSFCSLAYHLKWREETTMRVGGWRTPTVVHEIYTHLSVLDQNEDIDKMKEYYLAITL